MDAVIDRFGRVVIPKELRDALGLKAGSVLQILFGNHEIRLKPAKDVVLTSKEGHVTVLNVQLPGDGAVDIVRKVRNARIAKVAGISEDDL